jgi:hypothetical protein
MLPKCYRLTFWDHIGPDPYQGTTSVVPTTTAGIKGFSPRCLSLAKYVKQ